MNNIVLSNQAIEALTEVFTTAGEYRQLRINQSQLRQALKAIKKDINHSKNDLANFGMFEDCGSYYQEKHDKNLNFKSKTKKDINNLKSRLDIKYRELCKCQNNIQENFPAISNYVNSKVSQIIDINKIDHHEKRFKHLGGELVLCLHGHIQDLHNKNKKMNDTSFILSEKIENAVSNASLYWKIKLFNKRVHYYVKNNPETVDIALQLAESEKDNLSVNRKWHLENITNELKALKMKAV